MSSFRVIQEVNKNDSIWHSEIENCLFTYWTDYLLWQVYKQTLEAMQHTLNII